MRGGVARRRGNRSAEGAATSARRARIVCGGGENSGGVKVKSRCSAKQQVTSSARPGAGGRGARPGRGQFGADSSDAFAVSGDPNAPRSRPAHSASRVSMPAALSRLGASRAIAPPRRPGRPSVARRPARCRAAPASPEDGAVVPNFVKLVPPGDERERDTCATCGWIDYRNPKVVVGCLPLWVRPPRPSRVAPRTASSARVRSRDRASDSRPEDAVRPIAPHSFLSPSPLHPSHRWTHPEPLAC